MNDEKKKLMLEALEKMSYNKKNEREKNYFAQKAGPDLSQNSARGALDKDVLVAKSSASGAVPTDTGTVVKGTDKINTRGVKQDLISGEDFAAKQKTLEKQRMIARFKKAADSGDTKMMDSLRVRAKAMNPVADNLTDSLRKGINPLKKGLKSIPIIGALAGLMGADDASAAIPFLDSADSVGMSASDEDQMISETRGKINYANSPAHRDRQEALQRLSKLGKTK